MAGSGRPLGSGRLQAASSGARLTIDASVFISASRPEELAHRESRQFLERVEHDRPTMFAPTLLLPELAGALGRRGGALASSLAFAMQVSILPGMHLIALDHGLARTAARLAGEQRLRGSDAVYGAVALAHAATLITLDQEQAMRLAPVLTALEPGNWP